MLFDVLLLVSILVCIIFCAILNKRMNEIRLYKENFMTAIKHFDHALIKTDVNLKNAHEIATNAEQVIRSILDDAQGLTDKITILHDKGNELANELEMMVISATKIINKAKLLQSESSDDDSNKNQSQTTVVSDKTIANKYVSDIDSLLQTSDGKLNIDQATYYKLLQEKRLLKHAS